MERRALSRRIREAEGKGPLDTTEARESRMTLKKRKKGCKKEGEVRSRTRFEAMGSKSNVEVSEFAFIYEAEENA